MKFLHVYIIMNKYLIWNQGKKKVSFLLFNFKYVKFNEKFQKKVNNKNVIIINPFYKVFMDGNEGIRIDNPDEFLLFDNDEKLEEFLKENAK